MNPARLSFSSLAFIALACGSTTDGGGGTGESVPISEVPKLYAEASCSAVRKCLGEAVDVLLGGESCTANTEAAIADDLPRLEQGIEEGKITYDGEKVRACIDAIETAGCDLLDNSEPEACRDALTGTVASGGDCSLDAECQGESYCKSGGTCPGKCTSREQAGGACDRDSNCARGLACSEATSRCVKPSGPGASCGGGVEPDCSAGYFCIGEDETEGRTGNCRSVAEVFVGKDGEECSFDEGPFCAPDLNCVVDSIDLEVGAVVTKCAKTAGAGGACKVGFPNPCPAGEYCKAEPDTFEGTCTKAPAAGEPCAAGPFDEEPSVCAPSTRCDGGTCRARQSLGGSCSTDDVCRSERCVEGACVSSGTCG